MAVGHAKVGLTAERIKAREQVFARSEKLIDLLRNVVHAWSSLGN